MAKLISTNSPDFATLTGRSTIIEQHLHGDLPNSFQNKVFHSHFQQLPDEHKVLVSNWRSLNAPKPTALRLFQPTSNVSTEMNVGFVGGPHSIVNSKRTIAERIHLSSNKSDTVTVERAERTEVLPALAPNESIQHWLKRIDAKPGEVFFCGFNPQNKCFEIHSKDSRKSIPYYLQFKLFVNENNSISVSVWGFVQNLESGWILLGNDNDLFENQFDAFYTDFCTRIYPMELPPVNTFSCSNLQFKIVDILFEQASLLRVNNVFEYFQELMMLSCNPSGEISSSKFLARKNSNRLLISDSVKINMLMFGWRDFLLIHLSEQEIVSVPVELYQEYIEFHPIRIQIQNQRNFDLQILPPGTSSWIAITRQRYLNNAIHFEPILREHFAFIDPNAFEYMLSQCLEMLDEQEYIKAITNQFIDTKQRAQDAYVLNGNDLTGALDVLVAHAMSYTEVQDDNSSEAKIIKSYEDYDFTLFGSFILKLSHDPYFIEHFGAKGLQLLRHGLAYYSFHAWYTNMQLIAYALNGQNFNQLDYTQKLILLAKGTDMPTFPFEQEEIGYSILHQLELLMFAKTQTEDEFKEHIRAILTAFYNPEN